MIRDSMCALAAAVLALALYAATLQPDLGGPEDTPKFQFLGYVLGTGHPPGYPLYVLLSHAFVKLPIGTIAYRANLFSAVLASLACAIAFAIGRQLGASRWTAVCAAGGLATGASFWQGAVFAEVYSLAAVMASGTVALLLAWDRRRTAGWLLGATAVFALGLGNHLTIVGLAPAGLLFVLIRQRRAITFRVVVAAACLLLVGLSQYGLILIRTRQGAPYLESQAYSMRELVGVVTATRFANQRFAFGPRQLIAVQMPETGRVIAGDLGVIGLCLVAIGLIGAARRRSAAAALVLGAAAGMFAMVINLWGDTAGFIVPIVALLWPVAALGIESAASAAGSLKLAPLGLRPVLLAFAAAIPISGLVANYRTADQSAQTGMAEFLRTVYATLPDRAGIIAEDYFVDMAIKYLMFTGEAGTNRDLVQVGFGADAVRAAARQRPVFAFGGAAVFFAAEGLRFEPAALAGPRVPDWIAGLPRNALVVGAAALDPLPSDVQTIARRRPGAGRPRAMTVFAFAPDGRATLWREDDREVALLVEPAQLTSPVALSAPLVLSADDDGARIDFGRRRLVESSSGLVLAAFTSGGSLISAFAVSRGIPSRAPLDGIFEFRGEASCADLTADGWTEIAPVLAGGSWLTTLPAFGEVGIEIQVFEPRGVGATVADLVGSSHAETGVSVADEADVWRTRLARTRTRRPVFRMAFDRRLARARARLVPGGIRNGLRICSDVPAELFRAGDHARINADLASEAFFGAGWSAPERTDGGYVRHAENGASLQLPLASDRAYRIAIDVLADGASPWSVEMNGVSLGSCRDPEETACAVEIGRGQARDGVNTIMIRRPGRFSFAGARVRRFP